MNSYRLLQAGEGTLHSWRTSRSSTVQTADTEREREIWVPHLTDSIQKQLCRRHLGGIKLYQELQVQEL